MNEEFLQFVWKSKLYKSINLQTDQNEPVEVIHCGDHNKNAGPDFLNAKIKIGSTLWAGSVEVHFDSSFWKKHHHSDDFNYQNVILQVVYKYTEPLILNGIHIPTLVLDIDSQMILSYQDLMDSKHWLPCKGSIHKIDQIFLDFWLNSLLIERLERKTAEIEQSLENNLSNWEESFYWKIARGFGFGLNADAFENTVKTLALNILAKHKNNLFQIEALLFGQAGFCSEAPGDDYHQKLIEEYNFLKHKYNLSGIEKHQWKFLRLRPQNFPTVRLAQFAALIHHSSALFSKVIESKSVKELYNLLDCGPSLYWQEHYMFGKASKKNTKQLGKSSMDILIINTIVPFLFIYGASKDDESLKNKAISLLEQIEPEINTITKNWKEFGFEIPNAFYSQAFIQQRNEYCQKKRCLDCRIGNRLYTKFYHI